MHDSLKGLPLARLGLPTQREFLQAYQRHGRRGPLLHWQYFMALSYFRGAAILQGTNDMGE